MAIVTWWNEALEALSGEAYFLEARRKTAGKGLVACENLFNTYVRAVCGQQVNTAVAEKMAQSVFRYAGDKCDNAADALAGSSVDALRDLGLSQTKAGALVAIAQKYVEGSFTAPALEALDGGARSIDRRQGRGAVDGGHGADFRIEPTGCLGANGFRAAQSAGKNRARCQGPAGVGSVAHCRHMAFVAEPHRNPSTVLVSQGETDVLPLGT